MCTIPRPILSYITHLHVKLQHSFASVMMLTVLNSLPQLLDSSHKYRPISTNPGDSPGGLDYSLQLILFSTQLEDPIPRLLSFLLHELLSLITKSDLFTVLRDDDV